MVFLFRDGRDVAVSYKNIDQEKIKSDYVPKLDKNIGSIATEWANNVQNFLRVMDQDKETIAVKYEDLLTNPENELCRVFNFLGEEFEGQTLNFHQFNDEPKEFLQWKSKTLEGVDDKNMNKYKTYLTDEEITEFNEIAKEQLLTLGYEV
jgi:predicted PolB exonuclease-like 3'-5' exonuclease